MNPLWASLITSIPSPSFNTIDIGPRPLTLYGLMIGFGIIAATVVSRPRAIARGLHGDTPVEMLMWVVPAGVVGARLYHVITDAVPLSRWHEIWNGGLGIPGAIGGGAIGALLFIKKRGLTRHKVIDAVVPGVVLAQAIGRWGNWWNQELYGEPTDLPWGLEIDSAHRLPGFETFETFHPTFLYESLWNLALFGFLLWIEALRIDPATDILGVRVNLWTMTIVLLASAFLLRNAFVGSDQDRADTAAASADDDDYDEDRAVAAVRAGEEE